MTLPSSLQRKDEIQNNILDISSEITFDTTNLDENLANTIQNAEIYISPNIDSTLEKYFTSSSTNSRPLCQIQNETSSLFEESDFCERRIVEEANTSATLNNKPQLQIEKYAKVDTVTRH